MKISYIECDICKKKITGGQYKYSLIARREPFGMPREPVYEEEIDICKSCMDGFKKWFSRVIKEAKDEPST